jgi:ribosomal protein L37AE/L43A
MVRILKNVRRRLVENGSIEPGTAPSYFLEGLLFNVPDDKFGKKYGDSFVAALNWIFQAERTNFVCASNQHYLVRDSAAVCWPCADCDRFLNAAAELWNNWT